MSWTPRLVHPQAIPGSYMVPNTNAVVSFSSLPQRGYSRATLFTRTRRRSVTESHMSMSTCLHICAYTYLYACTHISSYGCGSESGVCECSSGSVTCSARAQGFRKHSWDFKAANQNPVLTSSRSLAQAPQWCLLRAFSLHAPGEG